MLLEEPGQLDIVNNINPMKITNIFFALLITSNILLSAVILHLITNQSVMVVDKDDPDFTSTPIGNWEIDSANIGFMYGPPSLEVAAVDTNAYILKPGDVTLVGTPMGEVKWDVVSYGGSGGDKMILDGDTVTMPRKIQP